LEDVIEIKYGKGLPKRARKGGEFRVFGSNGEIGRHNEAFTKGTTLIIGRKGSVGEVHLSDSACWPIDTTYFVDDFPGGLNVRYLFRFLKSQDLADLDRSTAVPGINRNDLYEIKLPLPPLPEQRRIVAKIEALFRQSRRGREALDAVPDLLAQFRQAVLAAAFRGDLTERDPDDEPASVLLERILAERRRKWEEDLHAQGKDPSRRKYKEPAPPDTSDLPELPEGWMWVTVEQACQRIVDCLHSTPKFKESGYICVDTNSIKPGRIVLDKVRYVDEPTFHERNRRMIPREDDVLFSREGALLGVAVRVPANLEFCLGQRMMIFRLGQHVDAKYYEGLLNSPLFRSQYLPKISGTA
jgi:type I restriction enzyme S subunit